MAIKNKPLLRWSMAAVIAVIIGAIVYIVATSQRVSAKDLYSTYYLPYADKITAKNEITKDITSQARDLYQSQRYEEALPLFLDVLKTEKDNAVIQFASGICLLELDRFEKATQTFSSINNPLFKGQAHWYLAMTFLKQSDLGNARTVLEAINPGEYNYSKAQEIIAEL